MFFYSIVLLATVAASLDATKNLRSDKMAEQANYGGAFTIADHTYASKEEFILSGKRCGTNDPTEAEKYEVDQKLASMGDCEGTDLGLSINVYFHIITDSFGNGDLTQEEVQSQIDVLNDGYQQATTSFVLQGTTTTANDAWFGASKDTSEEAEMKGSLRVGDTSTLNIYSIANNQGILGWATFPSWIIFYGLANDGVVVDYRTLPGGIAAPYNEGDTLTHEVGHWMGLYHTFQGGCSTASNSGDFVEDTPAVAAPNFGCPPESTDSCPGDQGQLLGNDPVHNYMDYVDDSCMFEFTVDQVTRMRQAWNAYRA